MGALLHIVKLPRGVLLLCEEHATGDTEAVQLWDERGTMLLCCDVCDEIEAEEEFWADLRI